MQTIAGQPSKCLVTGPPLQPGTAVVSGTWVLRVVIGSVPLTETVMLCDFNCIALDEMPFMDWAKGDTVPVDLFSGRGFPRQACPTYPIYRHLLASPLPPLQLMGRRGEAVVTLG